MDEALMISSNQASITMTAPILSAPPLGPRTTPSNAFLNKSDSAGFVHNEAESNNITYTDKNSKDSVAIDLCGICRRSTP